MLPDSIEFGAFVLWKGLQRWSCIAITGDRMMKKVGSDRIEAREILAARLVHKRFKI